MENMELPGKTVGTIVGERRKTRRYHLLTRVEILGAGAPDVYWGSTNNISRTCVALCARKFLKPGQKVTVCFRFPGSPAGAVSCCASHDERSATVGD